MEVERGTVFGLLGPNGAGKTTLVRVLATLARPDSGRATIDGVDVLAQPEKIRSMIGLAGQFAAVDPLLTGRENLEMVGRLYRLGSAEAKRRAGETLERLSLSDAADRQVKTYSGGMRRRLDLGASLVGRAQVMILDEPTTGLDPRTRLELWSFLEDLVRDGITVLLTTQYLEEADRLARQTSSISDLLTAPTFRAQLTRSKKCPKRRSKHSPRNAAHLYLSRAAPRTSSVPCDYSTKTVSE
jgi:ABC-2 type transport system ATP-binding protein